MFKKTIFISGLLVLGLLLIFFNLRSKPEKKDSFREEAANVNAELGGRLKKSEGKKEEKSNFNENDKGDFRGELKVENITEGSGKEVKTGDILTVHYSGFLEDGTKFDSSYDRGKPFQFTLGVSQVIPGWDAGLQNMKKGGKRRLVIPPELAYGERRVDSIPPNSTLFFEVELLNIK